MFHTHPQVNQPLPSFLPPKLGYGVFTGPSLPLATFPHLAHSYCHPFVPALAWAEDQILVLLALSDETPLKFHQRTPGERRQAYTWLNEQGEVPPGQSRVSEGSAICVGSSLIYFSDNYSSLITNGMKLATAQPGRREGVSARRVENEPACVHSRKRSEWCVLSLCTEQGPWGCFNILLNVVFLLTLAGEVFSPERLLPTRLLAKFLGFREKGNSTPTTWAAPDELGGRACLQGWAFAQQASSVAQLQPAEQRGALASQEKGSVEETALHQAASVLPHLCSPNHFVGRHMPSFIDGDSMPRPSSQSWHL